MKYDLHNILDRERFRRRSNELYAKSAIVDLSERKQRRTMPQNSYLHLIIGWYAIETGNTVEYVKRFYFKELCNAKLFVIDKDDKFIGKVREVRSSRELNTSEMTIAIERFRNWSSKECSIYLPSPDEQGFLQAIDVELDKYEEYV